MSKQCKLSWCNKEAQCKELCTTHYNYLRVEGEAAPARLASIVGTRTVLAKTCLACGELKMKSAFRVQKRGYVQATCNVCMRDYNKMHPPKGGWAAYNQAHRIYRPLTREQQIKHQNDLKAMNAAMRDDARKLHEEWTQADLEYALNPANGTVKERAIKLGRTYKGVETQITKHRRLMREEEKS